MDDDQQFCLRWNNHQSTLVAVFDTLLENEKLVDCTLAAEGKFLNAHKVVLSACSPYFESLLSRHYDKHPILILKDVKFQELKAMMDYMYRGEVNISQDQLGALLKAAESLQIKGLSDNKKDDQPPTKRPAPAPAPPKSPQPQAQLPKVQGLTIEQRSRDDREGSMSPGPRKKKRMRRKSEEMDNHHDASDSSDAHSLPPQNIPSATTQLPANIKLNSDVPETIETKQEILTRHKDEIGSQQQVPMIKEKLETHTELMLEPKSEYVDEMNEDSIEDLTLDDDDLSNMDQMDDGAGPSHGGEGSSQGFGHWQMGNQSQDEVFLAAQEAVGAHRDSQASRLREYQFARRREQYEQRRDFERRPPPIYYPSNQRDIDLIGERRRYAVPNTAVRKTREMDVHPYQKSLSKPISQKFVHERRSFSTPYPITNKNATVVRKTHTFVAPNHPKVVSKPVFQKPVEKGPQPEIKKPMADPNSSVAEKHVTFEEPPRAKFNKAPSQEALDKCLSINIKKPLPIELASKDRNYQEFQDPSHLKFVNKRVPQKQVEERPLFSSTKPSANQGSGLLTDSLSCIFTRRRQKIIQHKIPQKRVFFEKVPQITEDQKEKEDELSDPESTYMSDKKYETPEKQCPEPPIISQATPNISNEDWFATKQRILNSVNRDHPPKSICEPQPLPENKCPEPPQISVDPHGFDIEPPDHLNKSVSPYVPTNSCERDEYNKYKTQQLKKESLLLAQKRYKQGFEAPSVKMKMVQEVRVSPKDKEETGKNVTDSFKEVINCQQYQRYETRVKIPPNDKEETGKIATDSFKEVINYQQYQPPPTEEEIPAYEPKLAAHDSHQQSIAYEPTRRYDPEPSELQKKCEQDYQQSTYITDSYDEQVQGYEHMSADYQPEPIQPYYDEQNHYKHGDYNESSAPQEMYATETLPPYENVPQSNYEEDLQNICPEAPHISEDSQMIENTSYKNFDNIPPQAPDISQRQDDNAHSYYQDDNYEDYDNFQEQQVFREPLSVATTQAMVVGNQKMCHRCSFQTTNGKKLRDHLKFVHGESTPEISPSSSQKSHELFSRREPKSTEGQNELFSRREISHEDVAPEINEQHQFQGRFKRRNTSAVVNIISSDVIIPARQEGDDNGNEGNEGEAGLEEEKAQGNAQDSGVLAALEYFETTKDQPKRPRPYRRNQDELLEDEWI